MKILKQMTKFLTLLAALVVCQRTTASGACSGAFQQAPGRLRIRVRSGKSDWVFVLTRYNQEKP
jgi:hypothetical protein